MWLTVTAQCQSLFKISLRLRTANLVLALNDPDLKRSVFNKFAYIYIYKLYFLNVHGTEDESNLWFEWLSIH